MKALAWALLLAASMARADQLEAGLGWLSDQVRRGLSLSQGEPSWVADAIWRSDTGWGLSAGLSTRGRDNPGGALELNLGVGRGGMLGERWAWQTSATRYLSLDGPQRWPSYAELSASATWAGRLQMTLAVAPDYPGRAGEPGAPRHGQAWIAEAGWHEALGAGWALDAGIGRVRYRRVGFADYGYGSVGLSWSRGPWQLVASRVFSDSPAPSAAGPRLLLSLLWRPWPWPSF